MKGYKKRAKRLFKAVMARNEQMNDDVTGEPDYLIYWQMDRLAEECSELIQAVMKVKRYPDDDARRDNLYEELSHVRICSDMIMSLLGKSIYDEELDKKMSQLEKYYAKELGDAG